MSLKIAIIIGSTRPGRSADKITKWYMDQVRDTKGMEFELIDLKEVNLPFLDEPVPASMNSYQNEHTKKWSNLISGFDGYIWITSEYNHAPPAPLKNAIDYLFHEWARKPVAFVGYGNMGGARAIEQLRMIAGELQMADIRLAVGVRNPWEIQDEVPAELIYNDPKEQIEQLRWWAEALKAAR